MRWQLFTLMTTYCCLNALFCQLTEELPLKEMSHFCHLFEWVTQAPADTEPSHWHSPSCVCFDRKSRQRAAAGRNQHSALTSRRICSVRAMWCPPSCTACASGARICRHRDRRKHGCPRRMLNRGWAREHRNALSRIRSVSQETGVLAERRKRKARLSLEQHVLKGTCTCMMWN